MLLRAVEHGLFRPLGAAREARVDVRIVSTTNVALPDEVAARRFRSDLYQRISPLRIVLPPLRRHIDDLDELVPHFLARAAGVRRAAKRVSSAAMDVLKSYSWPRNVRELEHLLCRATVEVDGSLIEAGDVERMLLEDSPRDGGRRKAGRPPVRIGRDRVMDVLRLSGGNKREAARRLEVSPATFYSLLRQYGIDNELRPKEFERT
jgi:DNA-binding NtrC family response regulator